MILGLREVQIKARVSGYIISQDRIGSISWRQPCLAKWVLINPILTGNPYMTPTRATEMTKGSQIKTCEPLSLLVAGAGFEPATFGL
jgi:hypothetical protein